jgi:hypothetical protein
MKLVLVAGGYRGGEDVETLIGGLPESGPLLDGVIGDTLLLIPIVHLEAC